MKIPNLHVHVSAFVSKNLSLLIIAVEMRVKAVTRARHVPAVCTVGSCAVGGSAVSQSGHAPQ